MAPHETETRGIFRGFQELVEDCQVGPEPYIWVIDDYKP